MTAADDDVALVVMRFLATSGRAAERTSPGDLAALG